MLTFNEFMESKNLSEGFFQNLGNKIGGFGDQAVAGGVSAAKGTGRALGSAARSTGKALGKTANNMAQNARAELQDYGLVSRNAKEQHQYDLNTLSKAMNSMKSRIGKQVLNQAITQMKADIREFKPTRASQNPMNLPEPKSEPVPQAQLLAKGKRRNPKAPQAIPLNPLKRAV